LIDTSAESKRAVCLPVVVSMRTIHPGYVLLTHTSRVLETAVGPRTTRPSGTAVSGFTWTLLSFAREPSSKSPVSVKVRVCANVGEMIEPTRPSPARTPR